MSKVEEVHSEGVKRIELGPVPIDATRPVVWDDAQKSYTSHGVRLGVCFLGIGGREETLAEDVLQQCTPSAVRDGYDVRTSLISVFVDNVSNSCGDVQGHLMLGHEEHLPKAQHVRVPMSPHRDCVRWIPSRGKILQEEAVLSRGSEPPMDEEERRFGYVIIGGYGTEELEVSSRGSDMST